MKIDTPGLWSDWDQQTIRGWVTSWGFSIRRTGKLGEMEARGYFRSSDGGTAIRVQMGAMPGMPILLGFVAVFAISLGAMGAIAIHSPIGLIAAAPAGVAMLYPRTWRNRKEADLLLRFLEKTLEAHVLSASPNRPCPPTNGNST